MQDWLGDDHAKRFRREVHFPSGRFGEAIEQAQAVVFLASDESSFVNGTDFVVDGGLSKVSWMCCDSIMRWRVLMDVCVLQAYVTAEGPAPAPPQNLGQ